MNAEVGPQCLTTLGIGAAVVVLQLFLAGKRWAGNRGVRAAAAAGGILLCTALLLTGHLAQRMRPAKHESFEVLSLRDRPAAVRVESLAHTGSRR